MHAGQHVHTVCGWQGKPLQAPHHWLNQGTSGIHVLDIFLLRLQTQEPPNNTQSLEPFVAEGDSKTDCLWLFSHSGGGPRVGDLTSGWWLCCGTS